MQRLQRIGQRFGRLLVVGNAGEPRIRAIDHRGYYLYRVCWFCRCDCGTEMIAFDGCLKKGTTNSCGCLRREMAYVRGKANFKHGHAQRLYVGIKRSRTLNSYNAMHQRCRPNHPHRDRYADRGIAVCLHWSGKDGFLKFLTDMGIRPEGLSLDRKDVSLGYSPDNCRWSTPREQRMNQERMQVCQDEEDDTM